MHGFLSGDEDADRLGLGGLGRGVRGGVGLVLGGGHRSLGPGFRERFGRRVAAEAEAEGDRREQADRGKTESHGAPLQTSTSTVLVEALETVEAAAIIPLGAPYIADQARSR